MRKKLLSLSILGFITIFMITSSSTAFIAQDDSLTKVTERGKLIIGTEAQYEPFEYVSTANKEIIGFDADIAHVIANELGVEIEWVDTGFDSLVQKLKDGSFDCVIAAMTITEEREEEVDFSRWYYKSAQAIMVAEGNPKSLDNITAMNATGITVGYLTGSTSDIYANDHLQNAEKLGYSSILLAIQSLNTGAVDAVIGDYAVIYNEAIDSSDFDYIGTFELEDFGIAVTSGSDALLTQINLVIKDLLGSSIDNPVPSDLYNTIYYKWFEENAAGYEGTVTDAEIPYVVAKTRSAPGFEFYTVFIAMVAFPLIRKYRK